MFRITLTEIQERAFACKKIVKVIQSLDPSGGTEIAALKGLMFVHLYGIYEYAVEYAVQSALYYITAETLSPQDLHLNLLTLVLDAEFRSVADSSRNRTWGRRLTLVERFGASTPLTFSNSTLFPTDGSHYRVQQLRTIWQIFGLVEAVVPEPRLLGRVDELVENRNAIAHGRRTPEDVGGRYSIAEIEKIVSDVETISGYIVEAMEKHCHSGGLKRQQITPSI